jgi:hypothetical protein
MPRTGDELANDIFRAGAMNGVAFVEREAVSRSVFIGPLLGANLRDPNWAFRLRDPDRSSYIATGTSCFA